MISLFRKLRQKLLAQNRIPQYLTYAIGEIFLVVIGILIALQINTWKEERANRNNEISFYSALMDDLKNDKIKIEQLNEFYEHRIEVLTWLLTRVRNPSLPMDGESFGQNIEPFTTMKLLSVSTPPLMRPKVQELSISSPTKPF